MSTEPTFPANAMTGGGAVSPAVQPILPTDEPLIMPTLPPAPSTTPASASAPAPSSAATIGGRISDAAKDIGWQKIGVGAAIGSAAIAAALLYARGNPRD